MSGRRVAMLGAAALLGAAERLEQQQREHQARLQAALEARGVEAELAGMLVACHVGSVQVVTAARGDPAEFYWHRIKALRETAEAHGVTFAHAALLYIQALCPPVRDSTPESQADRLHWWSACCLAYLRAPAESADTGEG